MVARSLLAGEPSFDKTVDRVSETLGRPWRWIRPLAKRYIKEVSSKVRPRLRNVLEFLARDPGFVRASFRHAAKLSVAKWLVEPQKMRPVAAARDWNLPAIESAGALADWLGLDPNDLEWFADLKGLGYKKQSALLSHYHYRVLSKTGGSVRLIEAPKPRLKELQRRILTGILEQSPAHPAAHGFLKGRSIQTFVAPHVCQRVVLRMDLRNFFTSIRAPRIQAVFRTLGYPESVADLLGGICTNAAPRRIWNSFRLDIDGDELEDVRALYAQPHLPQGAPTSPALANLCAFRIDCRLAGLARSVGAAYTRYADDLAFSGDAPFERMVDRFSLHVAAILMEEGFTVHHRKTRVMRQGVRQHLAGLVTNQRMNVMRPDFDRIKATLTNCVRLGPAGQNRKSHPLFRSHLDGRIAFVEFVNPAKGARLRKIFDQIQWE